MTKKIKSTYDELMESLSPKERKEFEKEYKELLLSELPLAIMAQDNISVRKLAKLAGVFPKKTRKKTKTREQEIREIAKRIMKEYAPVFKKLAKT